MKLLPLPNTILLTIFTFLLSLLIPAPQAHAELLGSWTFTNHMFSGGDPVVSLTPTYWFGPDHLNLPPTSFNLFENLVVGPDDIGVSWTATVGDDPDFSGVVDLLTDDLLSAMGIQVFDEFGGFRSTSSSEAYLFFGFAGDPDLMPFRDFAGSTIDAFTVTLDDFFITQQGAFNVSNFTFTFGVHGTIPAPGPLPLLALSACLTRRKRKQN